MGLAKGFVKLETYQEKWKDEFQKEKKELAKIFGDEAVTIEHIGSTAIIGLSAKPIIDIAVGVSKLEEYTYYQKMLEGMDDYSVKENSDSDEILIRKGDESNRTHFIHVMQLESVRYIESVVFRDYLNKYPNKLKEYQDLKEHLAKEYANDRPMYTKSKNDFIKATLELAYQEKDI